MVFAKIMLLCVTLVVLSVASKEEHYCPVKVG